MPGLHGLIQKIKTMPQSIAHVIVHIIFSTKDRRAFLSREIRERLFPYIAQVIRCRGSECYRVGGVEDHVHLAVRLSRTDNLSKLVSEIKTSTSRRLKEFSPGFDGFTWQQGYGAFSVSPEDLEALVSYIDKQEEHHAKMNFKDEMIEFFKSNEVDYDERYIWG